MALVHDEPLPTSGCPPVDGAHAIAGYELADIGVLDSLALHSRDLAARERLRLERGEEPLDGQRARIRLQAREVLEACLPGDESERVARADLEPADVEDTPPPAAQAELERATLARAQAQAARPRSAHDLDSGWELEQQVEPIDRSIGAHLDDRGHFRVLERALGEVERDGDQRLARRAGPDREEKCERGGQHGELGPPERQCADEADRSERRVAEQARATGSGHAWCAATASSARGVGTVSSTSRTTSSAVMRCTQSSGRRTSRWASAGTAMALTSSGRT